MDILQTHTSYVKSTARELGFDYCGISRAAPLDEDARRLEKWLQQGFHGKMDYMARNFELRIDPTRLVPGAKSVITLLMNYYPEKMQDTGIPKVSKYAYGTDYHLVIREKLRTLLARIQEKIGHVEGRGFVDSAPVLERSWAVKSGLGWVGKNGNFITRQQGSFLFIANLITDLALAADPPFAGDFCGSCTRCVDHCPTGAILEDKVIDGSKCISYYTIELKDALLPEQARNRMDGYIFGCDTCQDVCPWNRFSRPHDQMDFVPLPEILHYTQADWEALSEEAFRKIFKDSPISRTRYSGIRRNLQFLSGPSPAGGD